MAGPERWWSPRGVLRDMVLAKLILPTAVVGFLVVMWLAGVFS